MQRRKIIWALHTTMAEGVAKDQQEAVRWYRMAADQGDAAAQYSLGWAYNHGEGVAKDQQEAVRWWRMAAEQGYAVAQTNLGVAYDNGEGVAKDQQEAVRWYRMAADQGYAKAQYNLGVGILTKAKALPKTRKRRCAGFAWRRSREMRRRKLIWALHTTKAKALPKI